MDVAKSIHHLAHMILLGGVGLVVVAGVVLVSLFLAERRPR